MDDGALPSYLSLQLDGWSGLVLIHSGNSAHNRIEFDNSEAWRKWLGMLVQDVRSLPAAKVLKTSDTVDVWDAQFPKRSGEKPVHVVCKQVKQRGIKDAIVGLVRPSSARRTFEKAIMLEKAGVETARPLAYWENKSSRASWLITEFLEDVIDLDSYVLTCLSRTAAGRDRDQRSAIVRVLVGLCRAMRRAGLYHRDMKASNILLIDAESSRPRACIVDLEGLKAARPWRSQWKPVVRLAASLLQYPAVTRTDYARFLRVYLRRDCEDPRAWRMHFHRLRKQAARYVQAAHKRKSSKLDGFSGG